MTVTTQNPPIWGTSNCNGCKTCTLSFGLHSTQSPGGNAFISSFWKGASPASTESNLTFPGVKWPATEWSEDGQYFAAASGHYFDTPFEEVKGMSGKSIGTQNTLQLKPRSCLSSECPASHIGTNCSRQLLCLISLCLSVNDPTHSPIFRFRCELSLFWSTVDS